MAKRQLRYYLVGASLTLMTLNGVSVISKLLQMISKESFQDVWSQPSSLVRTADHAIFYHIYVPLANNTKARALEIIQEQIEQVASSVATNSSTILYYNTIGDNATDIPMFIDEICEAKALTCRHKAHYDRGFEEITLQNLYDFCASDQSSNASVTYLHSKGTFHGSPANDRLRRHLTAAALSEHCLSPPKNYSSCNACGLFFAAAKSAFFPGNMYTARCDYVRKLKTPDTYHDAVTEVVKDLLLMSVRNQIVLNHMFSPMPSSLGIDRYTNEMWIGSHPSLEPCSVSPDKHAWEYWLRADRNVTQEFTFVPAPRVPMENQRGAVSSAEAARNIYLLAGQVLRWDRLYGEVPANDSWVWTHFPDGEKWLKAVQQHGATMAVENMTAQFKKG